MMCKYYVFGFYGDGLSSDAGVILLHLVKRLYHNETIPLDSLKNSYP